ncbi:MAG: hypothetical protein RBU37_18715 [Myxococcota bacterium]|jgi:hypothetical protein|nr:hypothetical protein [Myxococcota bacterium]
MDTEATMKRQLNIHWIGPFSYLAAYYKLPSGLYLVYVGQHPIFLGASTDFARSLSGHAVHTGSAVHPVDMIGRELLSYARRYNQRLLVKLGQVKDGETLVKDLESLDDVVSLINFHAHFPCNAYGREAYLGKQSLRVENTGKHYPLESSYEAEVGADVS